MSNLESLIRLNDLERQLNELQELVDALRAANPANGELQYRLDIQQQLMDIERERIMNAKSLFISPN